MEHGSVKTTHQARDHIMKQAEQYGLVAVQDWSSQNKGVITLSKDGVGEIFAVHLQIDGLYQKVGIVRPGDEVVDGFPVKPGKGKMPPRPHYDRALRFHAGDRNGQQLFFDALMREISRDLVGEVASAS